ncbi:hypothetical protein SKAU_G00418180 [Synaphobranchus kaupii]|uniref:Uncharacterized protein n=1 Tax=Synaphobranchus kaupii TaxID=118154 RepID=A0A9Q1E626_SYNKA|nr:hypothetical protein SKAU_G00418180 [Synaphobranchus kaupii]
MCLAFHHFLRVYFIYLFIFFIFTGSLIEIKISFTRETCEQNKCMYEGVSFMLSLYPSTHHLWSMCSVCATPVMIYLSAIK